MHSVLHDVMENPIEHSTPREANARCQTHSSELTAGQSFKEWADANAAQIDQYNIWALQREPYSQRVRRWRDANPSGASDD